MATQIDSLSGLVLFARIVQHGSMSAAARHSGMSRSAISKQLSALETRLGARLLQRSTRSLTLTEAGSEILEEALRVTEALNSIETLSEQLQGQVRGHLKVSCSSGIGKMHLLPLLKEFSQQFPDVHIQLFLEDRVVD
jgi:DNA-binding transcriptional LysR family regulator